MSIKRWLRIHPIGGLNPFYSPSLALLEKLHKSVQEAFLDWRMIMLYADDVCEPEWEVFV